LRGEKGKGGNLNSCPPARGEKRKKISKQKNGGGVTEDISKYFCVEKKGGE